jgi:hypothetical protein
MTMPNLPGPRLAALIAAAVPFAVAPAQNLTFVAGNAQTALDVLVFDEHDPAAAPTLLLAGIELLPIDLVGRTLAQDIDFAAPRRLSYGGFRCIGLPDGGRLFHYRRLGDTRFGYLQVPAAGGGRVLLELCGTGGGGTEDPFRGRIAVARDGHRAVLPLADGACHLALLDGGTYPSTGTATRCVAMPAAVRDGALMAGSTCAFLGTAGDRLWRLPFADGAAPAECTPAVATSGNRMKDEFALSGDGSAIAVLYGPQDQQRIWLVRGSGAPVAMPLPPAHYEEPGYLPAGDGSPLLLLNGDATRLFCVTGQHEEESWLVDTTGQLAPRQITDDPLFEPWIGVHILPSFVGTTLVVAIGEAGAMDWFRVELGAGGVSVANLTGTGAAAPPFTPGTLAPVLGGLVGSRLLSVEFEDERLVLRAVDPATAQSQVLLADLQDGPRVGTSFGPAPDVLIRGPNDLLLAGASGAPLFVLPPGVQATAPGASAGWRVTWLSLGQLGAVVVYDPVSGVAGAGPLETGVGQVALTQAGGLVVLGGTARYYAPRTSAVLPLPNASIRVLLSGVGG